MISLRLLVERGSFRDKSQEWGRYDFLSPPSPGDRITVQREDGKHYLTVLCVHHQPVVSGSDTAPAAYVVAKWTGSDRPLS